jgi:hypothetical protein
MDRMVPGEGSMKAAGRVKETQAERRAKLYHHLKKWMEKAAVD